MNVLLIVVIIILVLIIFCTKKIISYYDYKKSINRSERSPYTRLSGEESFNLEKICLEELEKHYECQCKIKKIHFPFILDSYNENTANKQNLILTSLGKSLNNLSTNEKNKFKKINFDEQINCILYNLNKSKVNHLDMHKTGKNMTINKDGHLGLIDFNMAYNHNFTSKNINWLKFASRMSKTVNKYEEFDIILKYCGLKDK
tara:strand:+ start:15087 stop:15692 length:606 start_codon:yes stop_codon:yes gene_type:complete